MSIPVPTTTISTWTNISLICVSNHIVLNSVVAKSVCDGYRFFDIHISVNPTVGIDSDFGLFINRKSLLLVSSRACIPTESVAMMKWYWDLVMIRITSVQMMSIGFGLIP
jgi:hypothetical protein